MFSDIHKDFVGFDGLVFADDTEAGAGSVEKDTVEVVDGFGDFTAIVVGDDDVGDAETLDVELEGTQTLLLDVVGEDDAGVLHELGDVSGFASRGGGQVEDLLVGLGVQGQHWQERRGALQHVVPGEVLRGGSDWHPGLIDLQPDLAPFRQLIQIHTSLQQCLSQLLSPCLQRIDPNRQRSLCFIRFKELYEFIGVQESEEMIYEFGVVAVVGLEEGLEFLEVVFAGFAGFSEALETAEDGENLLDLHVDHGVVVLRGLGSRVGGVGRMVRELHLLEVLFLWILLDLHVLLDVLVVFLVHVLFSRGFNVFTLDFHVQVIIIILPLLIIPHNILHHLLNNPPLQPLALLLLPCLPRLPFAPPLLLLHSLLALPLVLQTQLFLFVQRRVIGGPHRDVIVVLVLGVGLHGLLDWFGSLGEFA